MSILQPGAAAPAFRLPANDGSVVDSGDLGPLAVLVFYPANNTPG